jgi:hypothetical protein
MNFIVIDFLRLKLNSNTHKLIKVVRVRNLSKITCRIIFEFFPQQYAVIESIVASVQTYYLATEERSLYIHQEVN